MELVPLLSMDEENQMNKEATPEVLPILPLRNTVLFPGVVIPITAGRTKSNRLVNDAYQKDKIIGVIAQKNTEADDPVENDLYKTGTVAQILKVFKLPDGNTTVIIQGKKRFEIAQIETYKPYIRAKIHVLEEKITHLSKKEVTASVASLKELALNIIKLNPSIPVEARFAIENIESPTFLTNFLASNVNAAVADKQKILETEDWAERTSFLMTLMAKDLQMLELKDKIQNKAKKDINQQQKDYYLRQQIRALHEELGEESPDFTVDSMKKRAKKKKWNKDMQAIFDKEIKKLPRMNPAAPDYSLHLNYIELLLELPWDEYTTDNFDMNHAKEVLDEDHFGLEKVKERILEYLAVLSLKKNMKAPILCLCGPPGVGKTSLGKSVAKALDRKYVRISLGGLHDEAEIRGHRKTYIGAMPGRIIQSLKKIKSANPVFVLDEVDKIGADFRGNPAYALLEVLDPEQNHSFIDNYVEHGFDLSKVLFIATANSLDGVHTALRDRMEVIEISGYTLEEKTEIALNYLLPKQVAEHALENSDIELSKPAIHKIIESYTHESGVRNLERKIAAIARNAAKNKAMGSKKTKVVDVETAQNILGKEEFINEKYQDNKVAGVVTGLAWTPVGGDILFVETGLSQGKGKLTLSGHLGDVMKESALAALTYLKSHSKKYKIDPDVFEHFDIHIHIPAGAIPKDGPSAGVTLLTSLFSAFTQRKVKDFLAMTGEITLRGKVLPVGGIKEKILAAKRAGIKTILLPMDNQKDITEIKPSYLEGVHFHYVKYMNEVLEFAVTEELVEEPFDLSFSKNNVKKEKEAEMVND
ncbi:MAG: endopeptidase La [Bacteroidetes bacterium RIFCSPLOWO2_02_FULL_36_8]|nr:MAG: endopeptidase La [Bacteroidetes bacterium RIFCSPLOWO2_02_FULL_36_8]OFY69462.1 MAG: endopeptidase La [Bacteroidetes bacterium RIFCSPLOWO2_12_FULL_37_12]